MILVYGLTLLVLLGRVEPHKLSFKPPTGGGEVFDGQQPAPSPPFGIPLPPPPAPPALQAHPIVQQQEAIPERERPLPVGGVKGGAPLPLEKPLANLRQPEHPQYFVPIPQPQTLAYVIIRPIQGQYQPYPYNPYSPYGQHPIYQPAHSFYQQSEHHENSFGTKGREERPLQPLPVEQHPIRAPEAGVLHTAEEIPPPPGPGAPGQDLLSSLDAKKQGKFSKLKSSLEQFAASAKSKLTLGSSYQFVNEEVVPPPPADLPPAPQPVQFQPVQHPIEQVKVQQQHIEQESLRENEPLHVEQQKELPKIQQQQQEELKSEGELKNDNADFKREQTRLAGPQADCPIWLCPQRHNTE